MDISNILNGWEIKEVLGEGAFGKVYKITKEDFGYEYKSALKVIEIPKNQAEVAAVKNEGLDDASVTEYYKSVVEDIVSEFVLMSKLKGNSNIVSYEDHKVVEKQDEFGWNILIRMELLTPLFTHIENNKFTNIEIIKMGIDICSALEICQKFNIIHRDIKPENIFVSDIGTYKLGDFGIARQLERTTSGLSKKGTFTYMAPEVYKGFKYNSTVDIYSLGIVLYRFLNNNRAPFMPPAPQIIKYSDKENANALRLSGQPFPKPCNAEGLMVDIINKACAYDPKERYQSPKEMREDLKKALKIEKERALNAVEKTAEASTPVVANDDDATMTFTEPSSMPANDDDATMTFIEQSPAQNNKNNNSVPTPGLNNGNNNQVPMPEQNNKNNNTEKKSKKKYLYIGLAVFLLYCIGTLSNEKEELEKKANVTTKSIETTVAESETSTPNETTSVQISKDNKSLAETTSHKKKKNLEKTTKKISEKTSEKVPEKTYETTSAKVQKKEPKTTKKSIDIKNDDKSQKIDIK